MKADIFFLFQGAGEKQKGFDFTDLVTIQGLLLSIRIKMVTPHPAFMNPLCFY